MFPPTPEQEQILHFARNERANGLVNALAGTGKTTTIEMICHAIPDIPILYLAFNKRIVEEAKKRMPSHADCRTQNSLGHNVWSQAIARRLSVSTDKTRTILNVIIGELKGADKADARDGYTDILRLVQRAKRDGYVPPAWIDACPNLIYPDVDSWIEGLEEAPSRLQMAVVNETLRRSIIAAYEAGI